mgnify:CR=1 FL=1
MIHEGKVIFRVQPTVVWKIILDVEQFSALMPGVETVTRVDDRTFEGAMKARVGPMSGEFAFRAQIVENNPPTHLRVLIEGTDSLTKSTLISNVSMTLAPMDLGRTELAYRADVEIQGRLAIIGDMVLRAAGAEVISEFFNRMRAKVEGMTC